MARESNTDSLLTESVDNPIFSSERRKYLSRIAVFIGALSFVGAAESTSSSPADLPNVPMRATASAHGNLAPAKWTGALEDAAKQPDELAATKKMDLLQDLVQSPDDGTSHAYVKESIWASPGQIGPSEIDFANLENSIRAAQADNINVCLAVWPYTWGKEQQSPPLTPSKRWQYTTLLATIDGRLRHDFNTKDGEKPPVSCWFIGNEPNNPTFWRPQFNTDGTAAAPGAYEALLARSYDTLKKISPDNIVIGGELASHGNDDPHSDRANLSPVDFIEDMGTAYRKSGRTEPIMDAFGYHPYGLNSSESPATPHPNSTTIGVADYPKLVSELGKAFKGTAQAGSKLPILYSEYGVESLIPAAQRYRYGKNSQPASAGAVDEKTQGEYYSTYLKMAACQPNVIGAFIFHTLDERSMNQGWQSGPNYADGAPKSDQPAIADSMQSLSNGEVACP